MHAAVVKLNPLANSVGTGTQDDDAILRRSNYFGIVFPRGVVIRRRCIELGRTGVDGLKCRKDSLGFAQLFDVFTRGVDDAADLSVREAELLDAAPGPSVP